MKENHFRFRIFSKNYKLIEKHNKTPDMSYTLAVNKFADLTYEEFKTKYLMNDFNVMNNLKSDNCNAPDPTAHKGRDESAIDWSSEGMVQRVKDQGQCGSCWAFSTVGALESSFAIKGEPMPDLSEQELVDCTTNYGNAGCNGGLMNLALEYIIKNGIHTESEYPYKAVDEACKTELPKSSLYKPSDCVIIPANTDGLTAAIRVQPVSVAFFVNSSFQFYSSGIFDPWFCFGSPNHAVLAVGFDLTNKKPFYKVKNSWGESWGDKGYFKIKIGKRKGTCTIAGSGWNVYPVLG